MEEAKRGLSGRVGGQAEKGSEREEAVTPVMSCSGRSQTNSKYCDSMNYLQ